MTEQMPTQRVMVSFVSTRSRPAATKGVFPPMPAGACATRVAAVNEPLSCKQVEVRFVGQPPIGRIESAQGVTDVDLDGPVLRCFVSGSFQPLLEAVSGYEVIDLNSVPVENERSCESRRTSL